MLISLLQAFQSRGGVALAVKAPSRTTSWKLKMQINAVRRSMSEKQPGKKSKQDKHGLRQRTRSGLQSISTTSAT